MRKAGKRRQREPCHPAARQDGHETQVSLPIAFTLGRFVNELTFSDSRRRDDFEDPADPFITGSTTDSKTRRAHLSTRFVTPVGTLVAGGEYERAVVNDVTNFGPNFEDARRTSRSFFIEDRYSHEVGAASSQRGRSGGIRNR